MALKMRLARGGAKKRPFYRIVVADSRSPRDGRYIERLGYYDPLKPKEAEDRLKFDAERVQYWLGQGAQPTDRVARFLSESDIVPKPVRNNPQKAKPKAKAQERLEAAQEAAAAPAAEAPAAPAAEAPVEQATEAPAEEAAEAPAEEAAEAPAEETTEA